MAFPPRFGMPQQFMTTYVPVAVQAAPSYFVQQPMNSIVTSGGPRGFPRHKPPPAERPPTTTVFVGNIHERCSNDLIRAMLQECGNVINWRRIQGSNGKFQAFGFCEYDYPESTLRALRILNGWRLGDKKILVKVDDKTRELLRGFIDKKRQVAGRSPLRCEKDELPADEENSKTDAEYRKAIDSLVRQQAGDLAVVEEGEISARSPTLHGKGGNLDIDSLDRDKKEYIAREISHFRETHKDEEKKQKERDESAPTQPRRQKTPPPRDREQMSNSPAPPAQRSPAPTEDKASRASVERVRSRSAIRSTTGSRVGEQREREIRRVARKRSPVRVSSDEERPRSRSSTLSSRGSKRRRRERTRSRSRSRTRSRADSEEEEEARERKQLERKLKEKEKAYNARLVKWETRERRRAKEYERMKEKRKKQRREEQREAKKLKEFLEDYEDERDDPKFYKSSSLFQRRREYEKEREMDARDRQREREEVEEIKKRLTDEGHTDPEQEVIRIQKEQEEALLKKLRAESSEPPTPRRMAQKEMEENMMANGREPGEAGTTSDSSSSSPSDTESESDQEGNKKKLKKKKKEERKKKGQELISGIATEPQPQYIKEAPKLGFGELKLNKSQVGGSSASVAQVFGEEEETNVGVTGIAKKAFVPLELTEEERAETMTPEERKKMIKNLIEKIPTTKERLFEYPINWKYVDENLIQKRVRPWVNKKIIEYIGEEEQSLVDFICQKVAEKVPPANILEDIAMVLDEEAEVFVVKMWRLLVYESEAKKLGLVKPDGSTS